MMLRKWRVARVNPARRGGYDSPLVRFWTRRGASAAAEQLENLEEFQTGGIAPAFTRRTLRLWSPIRHRTLCSAMSENIIKASGAYDRHPAGSSALRAASDRITPPLPNDAGSETLRMAASVAKRLDNVPRPFHRDMTLAEYWLEGPGSELLRRFDTSKEYVNREEKIGDDDRDGDGGGDGDAPSRATAL